MTPTSTPTLTPTPTPTLSTPPAPAPANCFDDSVTIPYANELYYPAKDYYPDPNGTYEPHCLPTWNYWCFGLGSECTPVQPTRAAYGCGALRGRIGLPNGTNAGTPTLFDSPLSTTGRRPGLVGSEN